MFPLSDFRSSKVKNRIMHEKSVFTAKIVVKTLFLVSYVRKYKLKKIVCRNGTETVENATIAQYTYDKFEAGTYMIRVTAVDEAGNKRAMDLANALSEGVMGLAKAIAKGMITQALLNYALTKVLGKAANTVVKLIGIAQDTGFFIEVYQIRYVNG